MALLLKEDSDLMSKVLRVGIDGTSGDASARGGEPYVELTDLAAELKSEAADAADPLERWADVSARRSLFDRALVGRLSSTAETMPRLPEVVGREGIWLADVDESSILDGDARPLP